jgi:quercetin dioxygenase-like cupin family protein
VRTIVDNEQVLVSRHRLPPLWLPTEAPHFHPRDVVLVYLAGGQIDGATGYPGVRHARRGDVDVIPANVLHEFRNLGNDPIEFVMITPK